MDKDWEKAFSTSEQFLAEIISGMLMENDIPSVILNQKDSAYGMFGEHQLYVPREKLVTARYLIEKNQGS